MTQATVEAQAEVTIVTQTGVRADSTAEFEIWQSETGRIVANVAGFLKQTVLPPSPPAQDDWVILQRFASATAATEWLNSTERLDRLTRVQPLLTGRTDVHVVRGPATASPATAPVSVIISTRVKPGCEAAYRRWEQRVAVAQSAAKGLQGYRFEPPIDGVQSDWLAILRFDTHENLQLWLDSPVRAALVAEADDLTEEYHARIAQTGFDQWFPIVEEGGRGPAAWKQNMIVLLMLYPVAFLFGTRVQNPLLMGRAGMPFWLALFIGNIVGVLLLSWLVPAVSRLFGWWLAPTRQGGARLSSAGTALVVLLYAALLFVFSTLP